MKKHERLPFEVIVSATEGDPEAIATVMNFYDGYISKLCLRKLLPVSQRFRSFQPKLLILKVCLWRLVP